MLGIRPCMFVAPVANPVQFIAIMVVRIECLILVMGEKRLMRVKGLNLQKPSIFLMVVADKLNALIEGLHLWLTGCVGRVVAVDVLLFPHICGMLIFFKLACLRRNRKWR